MTLDLIAIIISGVALTLSGLAYFGTNSTRRRQWRIEAGKVAAEIDLSLNSINAGAERTKNNWHSMFAATGSFHSGRRESFDKEIELKVSEADKLKKRCRGIHIGVEQKSDEQLAVTIVQLREIQLRANELTDWFHNKNTEHRDAVKERRKNVEDRFK